jgi:hypothetical protein
VKWYNANRDELPSHQQEVLISFNGIYYITAYNSSLKRFYLKDEPETFFDLSENAIYWTEFDNPRGTPIT